MGPRRVPRVFTFLKLPPRFEEAHGFAGSGRSDRKSRGKREGGKRRREDVRERKREIGGRGNKVFQEGKWYRYKVVENGKKTRELVNVIAVGIATRRDLHREESELRLVLGRAK